MLQHAVSFIWLLALTCAFSTVVHAAEETLCKEIDYSQPDKTATYLLRHSRSIYDAATETAHHAQQIEDLDSILSCITDSGYWVPRKDDPRDFGFDYHTLVTGDPAESVELVGKISSVAMAVRSLGLYEHAISIQQLAVTFAGRGWRPSECGALT